jgi:hypothetical protein
MTERFELLSQLGKGGMGVVWKARNRESGDIVAVKLVHSLYADDPDYIARFEREVEVARRIDSPYVVKVLGYDRQDSVPYMAMEYVEGPSLRELLKDKGKLPWNDEAPPFSRPAPGAKRLIRQIAEGLAAAHAAGVIHRDIKPSNILIAVDGTAKLADFGIARAMDMTRLTGSSTMLGTPAYMSPDGGTTAQSDLYALGVVAYEMLAGAPPFVGDSQQQVLLKHLREPPDLEKLPAGARNLTGWLLEKEARRRPPSAAALVAVLDGTDSASKTAAGGRRWRPVALVAGPSMLGVVGIIAAILVFGGGGNGTNVVTPGVTETPTALARAVTTATTPIADEATASPTPTPTPATSPIPPTSTLVPPTATRTPLPPTATSAPTATPTFSPDPEWRLSYSCVDPGGFRGFPGPWAVTVRYQAPSAGRVTYHQVPGGVGYLPPNADSGWWYAGSTAPGGEMVFFFDSKGLLKNQLYVRSGACVDGSP